jgi:thiol-disulfide isomerase/thioredoxin
MRSGTEVVVFAGVVLSIMIPGGLLLRQNRELRSVLAGPPRPIIEGAYLPPLGGYGWDSHKATLVIALRSGCPYCEASMGFYGRIADEWKRQTLRAYPLVLYPDPAKGVRPEIRDMGRLTSMDYEKIGVVGTPTVLLVDSRGRVLRKWIGQLSPSEEAGLLATVRGSLLASQ